MFKCNRSGDRYVGGYAVDQGIGGGGGGWMCPGPAIILILHRRGSFDVGRPGVSVDTGFASKMVCRPAGRSVMLKQSPFLNRYYAASLT